MKKSEADQLVGQFNAELQKVLGSQGTAFGSIVATGFFHVVSNMLGKLVGQLVVPEEVAPAAAIEAETLDEEF